MDGLSQVVSGVPTDSAKNIIDSLYREARRYVNSVDSLAKTIEEGSDKAMESSDKRIVSWGSQTKILSKRNVPQRFEFDSKIFILTNMVVAEATGQLGEHLRAIASRTRLFKLHLEPHEVFARVMHVCLSEGMIEFYLKGPYKTAEMVDAIWRYFEANYHAFKQPDLRAIYKIIEEINDGADWQKSIAMSEMKKGCNAVRV